MTKPTVENTPSWQIWVDADALPRMLRELLIKTSDKYQLKLCFVANQSLAIAPSKRIWSIQVEQGADQADKKIVELLNAGDLVITQDIPLAAESIAKGAFALNPRGEFWNEENIKARLHLRDYMDHLRGSGVNTGGPSAMNEKDKRQFADALNRFVQRKQREK